MSIVAPAPFSTNPVRRLLSDLRAERAAQGPLPPGITGFSIPRTRRFERDPLGMLLDLERRFGPVFTLRVLHAPVVFMIGPEANHYLTVSHASNFRWREGSMGDLIPLLGDGLLTIDGAYHKRARRIMLPAFHSERLAAATDTMLDEAEQAVAGWRGGEVVDVYAWTRRLALRVAMRALFGFDPDGATRGVDMAREFERALGFYEREYFMQMLRGPYSPFAQMQRARRLLDGVIFAEISRRRAADSTGEDILSLLVDARDEDGSGLSDQEIRDQVMTLLFAGHDTTTSTVAFLFYELSRSPESLARLFVEQDEVLGGRRPSAAELAGGLPELEMAVDETLRLYPAAWIGPRRSVEPFEFEGKHVPGGIVVAYSSWVSHHLASVFPEPEEFRPQRFSPAEKAKLPKGAYVPFGGGSRTCTGMRFGQLEVKAIATAVLQRFALELVPGYEMEVRRMPTLSPRHGLPMRVGARS